MWAGDAAAQSRNQQAQSPQAAEDYTFKKGDFRLLVVPSMGLNWNDNVNLAKTNVLEDFIVTPAVGITINYPFTDENLLNLDFSIGYNWYLNNPQFSSLEVNSSSKTGLSFDLVVKDVTFNFHDWIGYSQGANQNSIGGGTTGFSAGNSANSTVANTATYGTFENTTGTSGTWSLNHALSLAAGYDHELDQSTSGQFSQINHSSELFFFRPTLQVHPKVSVGLDATATLTSYDQDVLNNNDAYTIGAHSEFRPDSAITVTIRGGYSIYQFQQTSASIQTTGQNSWYASLSLAHQIMDSVAYSVEAGHEVQLGIQSDLTEDWYVRPTVNWKIIKGLNFITAFFYEHGNEGIGNVSGNLVESYDLYGGTLSLQHELTSRLSLSLNYSLTLRSSSVSYDGYSQNMVGLQISYHPQ